MRLVLALLVVTLGAATTATVFSIWPVVADAPWEAETRPNSDAQLARFQRQIDELTADINQLQADFADIPEQVSTVNCFARGGVPPPRGGGTTLCSLQSQVNDLEGQIEDLQNQVGIGSDVEQRLRDLERCVQFNLPNGRRC